jgi:hypothetical protein
VRNFSSAARRRRRRAALESIWMSQAWRCMAASSANPVSLVFLTPTSNVRQERLVRETSKSCSIEPKVSSTVKLTPMALLKIEVNGTILFLLPVVRMAKLWRTAFQANSIKLQDKLTSSFDTPQQQVTPNIKTKVQTKKAIK